jgi:hypothetical protein
MGLLIGLIIWALFVTAGYVVGKQKGRVGAGVALAALLGVAGVIIMACLPAKTRRGCGATAAIRPSASRSVRDPAASR